VEILTAKLRELEMEKKKIETEKGAVESLNTRMASLLDNLSSQVDQKLTSHQQKLQQQQQQVEHLDLENEHLCQSVLQMEDIVHEKENQIQKLLQRLRTVTGREDVTEDDPVPADYVEGSIVGERALLDLLEVYENKLRDIEGGESGMGGREKGVSDALAAILDDKSLDELLEG